MDIDDVVDLLRQRVQEAGSVTAFAAEKKIQRTAVSRVLCGSRKPPPSVIVALGLRRVTGYEPR